MTPAPPRIEGDDARVGVKVLAHPRGAGTVGHTDLDVTLRRERGDWVVVGRRVRGPT